MSQEEIFRKAVYAVLSPVSQLKTMVRDEESNFTHIQQQGLLRGVEKIEERTNEILDIIKRELKDDSQAT